MVENLFLITAAVGLIAGPVKMEREAVHLNRSLGVLEKSTAILMTYEFKATFDNLIDRLLVKDECGVNPFFF